MPDGFVSGEQIELRAGDQRAVVVEVGAGLRSYAVGDRALLDGYGANEIASAGRGQVLMPWPNRIQDGSYEFAGAWHHLPLSEPGARNAIHGLVRWAGWSVSERTSERVVMEHTLQPQPGYPFRLALRMEYALSDGGLSVSSTATNVGREACPYGSGAHPYLTVGTETVDTVSLRVPGRTMLETDARGIPVASATVTGTEYDFREPRPVGATKLDNAYTDLERGDDGLARVELTHPDDGTTLTLWLGESYPYLEVFTGDPLPSVRRRSLAVEPMTCPPNAFRSGEGLIVLEPGESATGTWGIHTATTAPTTAGAGSARSDDVSLVREFLGALATFATTGNRTVLDPFLAADVRWVTVRRELMGLDQVRDELTWITPPEHFDLDFNVTAMTDLGQGCVASEIREVYRFKDTGNFAYARNRRLELTIRDRKIARYDMRIVG